MGTEPTAVAEEARDALRALARQVVAFVGVGFVAFLVHYGLLVGAVEGLGAPPVAAALVGYVAGGFVSYALNRSRTFASSRPHAEAGWRFGAVALVGFGLTFAAMSALTHRFGLPYLPAQVATTALVMIWSFWANRLWTFAVRPALVTVPAGR